METKTLEYALDLVKREVDKAWAAQDQGRAKAAWAAEADLTKELDRRKEAREARKVR